MAYYCLHKFHWPPSRFLSLPREEQAFITAAIQMRIETEKKQARELKAKSRK